MPDVKHFDPDTVLDQVVHLFWQRGGETAGVAEVVTATGLSRSSCMPPSAVRGGCTRPCCAATPAAAELLGGRPEPWATLLSMPQAPARCMYAHPGGGRPWGPTGRRRMPRSPTGC
ncbi:hypothetical protein [Sphaerisporangium dianthi]|uniref:HTH tetR-type domain-containing protein n=1 Tax=Sphaerisporangium dianthi TaxID=1436120 RepID=A0ABV9CL33_9ACTN